MSHWPQRCLWLCRLCPDMPAQLAPDRATAAASQPVENDEGGARNVSLPAAVSIDDLVWMGEEGEWIGAPGHVDLASFTAAADALSRRDVDPEMPDDELPSADGEAWHTWYRPMTFAWFEEHYRSKDRRTYASLVDDGAYEPCGPDDEGAEAWTMIATGA